MALREQLTRLKKEKGMTTEMLARLSGVPRGTINKLLNGETASPRMGTIRLLAGALGVSADQLCGTEKVEAPAAGRAIAGMPGWDFAQTMPDDSMLGARIRSGDTVLVSNAAPDDGQAAAVIIDGSATVRRIYHIEGGFILVSENQAYPPIIITGASPGGVRILGTAVGFFAPL